jgi:hypothetical protein
VVIMSASTPRRPIYSGLIQRLATPVSAATVRSWPLLPGR